ncbi:hypothetical protein MKQ70_16495 [Chitinophaga sedimenti]|uniref:hypothetical protein n=1 Tax=Chitinophaga sedimenti TaxID=2033606 RepID=UPI002006332B|nr:hypothetical protein [Chitinophaga sedimenti]MCK7556528.1 hypothetical protein [Chitinophaga sedimenti]
MPDFEEGILYNFFRKLAGFGNTVDVCGEKWLPLMEQVGESLFIPRSYLRKELMFIVWLICRQFPLVVNTCKLVQKS